jgi:hypothetical protein
MEHESGKNGQGEGAYMSSLFTGLYKIFGSESIRDSGEYTASVIWLIIIDVFI